MTHRYHRSRLFPYVLLPLAACAGSQRSWPSPIPLRALVVPIDEPLVRAASEGEHEGEMTPLRLDFRSESVSEVATSALGKHGFVSLATVDWGAAGAGRTYDSVARRQYVLEQAVAAGADVVVELGLRYDPEVFRRNADTFWLNYPLFLFAGPSNWFVGDQVYLADVELTLRVYDRHALEASAANLADTSSLLITVNAELDRVVLRFVDRAEGVGDYLTGVIVPSGFLARHSPEVEAELGLEVPQRVSEQLVKNLLDRRDELVLRTKVAPMFIDPAKVAVTRDGEALVVRGEVELLPDEQRSTVRHVVVRAGDEEVRLAAPPGTANRVPIQARFERPGDAAFVRIECEAGARDRFVRSYTFPAPPAR